MGKSNIFHNQIRTVRGVIGFWFRLLHCIVVLWGSIKSHYIVLHFFVRLDPWDETGSSGLKIMMS